MSLWCRSNAQVAGFLDSLGSTPVLTKQQESGLTHVVRRGILLEQKYSALEDELGRNPSPQELSESALNDSLCPCIVGIWSWALRMLLAWDYWSIRWSSLSPSKLAHAALHCDNTL